MYIHTYTCTDHVHLQLTHWTTIRCNSYNVVSQVNIPIQEIVSAFPKEINNTQTISSSSLTTRQTHFLSTFIVYIVSWVQTTPAKTVFVGVVRAGETTVYICSTETCELEKKFWEYTHVHVLCHKQDSMCNFPLANWLLCCISVGSSSTCTSQWLHSLWLLGKRSTVCR